MMDILKDFYQDLDRLVDKFIESPYTGLLILGFLILFITFVLIITRLNYTKIIKMIDQGEERAISQRIEEWGEMIVNNLQQKCMERKLALTIYIIILPIFSLAMIGFSVYKLDMIPNLIITFIHLLVLFILLSVFKFIRKGLKNKKNIPAVSKENVPSDNK
jgi:hypothetical protein